MTSAVSEAAATLREAVRETVRKRSGLFLLQGALMILAGVLAFVFPVFTGVALLIVLGWLLILSGVAQGLSLFGAGEAPYFWLQLVAAALEVIVGLIILLNPGAGLVAATLLILVAFLVGGVSKVVFALMVRPMADWGWLLASGAASILCAGVLLSAMPGVAASLIAFLLGFQLIFAGAVQVFVAWKIRGATKAAA